MKNVKSFPFLFILLFLFIGCDKDDDDSKTETKADLIADKNWVLTGHTFQENNGPVEDEFVNYEVCEKDDIYRFAKNGTYEVNAGATKCASTDPQIYDQGTWSITGDNLMINEAGSSSGDSFTIVELTKSKLVLSSTESYQGTTDIEVVTFSKQ
ncbi:hypothetical protein AHMF7605_28245 [Adhaeribacter arboris]|uniref:Lipocalin-like domain-containing protein n=1 Tax=Adhaeribacter arboris TaxID=2072846 RepID=A0A2T2YNL8_9BACT|nr:lipocalin family protein [Adhaeribacter arboris]PSR57095.1 hypothetical protein AHMF7605_28245 [Adhaeribacter arboris]